MTKQPFVSTTDSSLRTLSSTYDKDASTYTLLFDFVATGLRTIQFLYLLQISEALLEPGGTDFRKLVGIGIVFLLKCRSLVAIGFRIEKSRWF
jgi:hypothetical protein